MYLPCVVYSLFILLISIVQGFVVCDEVVRYFLAKVRNPRQRTLKKHFYGTKQHIRPFPMITVPLSSCVSAIVRAMITNHFWSPGGVPGK